MNTLGTWSNFFLLRVALAGRFCPMCAGRITLKFSMKHNLCNLSHKNFALAGSGERAMATYMGQPRTIFYT